MPEPRYDSIGAGYAETRREDPRIAARIRAAQRDLEDGTWEERHGHLRGLEEYDAGLRLLTARPA
jgi:hypothetical protein